MKQVKRTALTRRQFTYLTMSGLAFLASLGNGKATATSSIGLDRGEQPIKLGTTFSQLQCDYMGLNYREAFKHICSLGFSRIRLCSYWNEIESVEGQFDFTALDWLLDESHKYDIEVVLTAGMKAPRWPEYHFPDWLTARYDTSGNPKPVDRNPAIVDHTLNFTQAVINHTREAPSIQYWQIENEPFTRLEITAGRFLSYEFVRREVELARSLILPGQKLLLTNALSLPSANLKEDDRAFNESIDLADAVGINVYTKVPAGNSVFYLQPLPRYWHKLKEWQSSLANSSKEHWIAEAQAEPWEPNQLVAMDKAEYPSASPKQATNLVSALALMGYDTVMLWGCEYWYWQKKNGREVWWQAMQQLING